MKACVLCLLVFASTVEVKAQGTVNFINVDVAAGLNSPFYQSDATTKLSGSQFMAELLGGSQADNLVSIATTGFLTGAQAGYFDGGVQTIVGVQAGARAFVEVRVWNTATGASYAAAVQSGLGNSYVSSPVFSLTTGGIGSPAALLGLPSLSLGPSIPEPSTLAIVGLGAVLFLRKGLTSRGNE